LDLGTVGDLEAERAEQGLDALERAGDGMEPAARAAAAGKGDVDRIGGELARELRVGERVATARERGLELSFGGVDRRACRGPFAGRQLAQRLEQIGERAGLAEVARLRVLERGR